MGWLPYILMGLLLTLFGRHRGNPNDNRRKSKR